MFHVSNKFLAGVIPN